MDGPRRTADDQEEISKSVHPTDGTSADPAIASLEDDAEMLLQATKQSDSSIPATQHVFPTPRVLRRGTAIGRALKELLGDLSSSQSASVRNETGDADTSVKIVLQSARKLSTSSGSFSGEAVHFDLTEGFPLNTFRKYACVEIPVKALVQSPFFRDKLLGAWKGQSTVSLDVSSVGLVDSYLTVLNGLVDPEHNSGDLISVRNQFQMFTAASNLGLVELQGTCKEFIQGHLNEQTFINTVKLALQQHDERLLAAVYVWLRRQGIRSTTSLAADPDAVHRTLTIDTDAMSLVYELQSIPLHVFRDVAAKQRSLKAAFFAVGAFTAERDLVPLRTPQKKNGVGFVGTTQFDVRRRRDVTTTREDGSICTCTQWDLHVLDTSAHILSARLYEGSSEFILSSSNRDFKRTSIHYIGSVTPNYLGTTFSVFDHGIALAPKAHARLPELGRREAAVIDYEMNLLGRVPNSMKVYIPRQDAELPVHVPLQTLHADRQLGSQILTCETRKPKWNERLDAWTMDFRGRVKVASKKNFQIVCNAFGDQVLLLFGKKTKDVFSLDFRAPFTAASAMGVILTSFADKLAVT